jgi:superfamily II DNA or RNA helicase
MELRDYQLDCLESLRDKIRQGAKTLLVISPVGSGKTVIFSSIVKRLLDNGKSVLIIVKKNILIDQTIDKLKGFGVIPTIYNAEKGEKIFSCITVASIQSLIKVKDAMPKYDYIVIDEVHSFSINDNESSVRQVLSNQDAIVFGFTATPFESTSLLYGADKYFKDYAYKISVEELVNRQMIMLPSLSATIDPNTDYDLSNVRITAGDYNQKDLEGITLDVDKVKLQLADAEKRSIGHTKIVVITTCIKHALLVKTFIPTGSILHSKMNLAERNIELNNFITGKTRYLISVLIASEGFDCPEADCMWFFRPTRSYTLYMQAIGRIMRISKDKTKALFLDYGGVVESLGHIYDIFDNIGKNNKKEKKLKKCKTCGEGNKLNADVCINCNTWFPKTCIKCKEQYDRTCDTCPACAYNPEAERLKKLKYEAEIIERENRAKKAREEYYAPRTAQILKTTAELTTSKAGNEMYVITYTISSAPFIIKQYITEKNRHFHKKIFQFPLKDILLNLDKVSEITYKKQESSDFYEVLKVI